MNGPLSVRRLQGAPTIDYFSKILQAGGAVDADFNASQLREGDFSAVLPRNTDARRIARFDEGALLAATEPVQVTGKIRVQAVPTATSAVSAIMAERMRRLSAPVLWVHEPMLLAEEISSPRAHSQSIQGHLYLVYNADMLTEAHIAEVIRYSTLSWHFLAFLTNQIHHVGSVSELVGHAQMILVGAYDGESVLLWERSQRGEAPPAFSDTASR